MTFGNRQISMIKSIIIYLFLDDKAISKPLVDFFYVFRLVLGNHF